MLVGQDQAFEGHFVCHARLLRNVTCQKLYQTRQRFASHHVCVLLHKKPAIKMIDITKRIPRTLNFSRQKKNIYHYGINGLFSFTCYWCETLKRQLHYWLFVICNWKLVVSKTHTKGDTHIHVNIWEFEMHTMLNILIYMYFDPFNHLGPISFP